MQDLCRNFNEELDFLLHQARAEGDGARDTIRRWVGRAESTGLAAAANEARCAHETLPREARHQAHRAWVRLQRAGVCLTSPGTVAFGDHHSHFVARSCPVVRESERSVPLEKRGRRPGAFAYRRAWRTKLSAQSLSDAEYTALRHFMALAEIDSEFSAQELFLQIASHYDSTVRRLWAARRYRAVKYGAARLVGTTAGRTIQAAGVVLKAIRRERRTGRRTLLVEFRHSGGKRTFEVEIPFPVPEIESLDMTPGLPETPPLPDGADQVFQNTSAAMRVSPDAMRSRLAAAAPVLWLRHFGRSCEHCWRYGRMKAVRWSRSRGNFIYENGVWIEHFDPLSLNVTLVLERSRGRFQRLTLPALVCVAGLSEVEHIVAVQHDGGRLFALCGEGGESVGYAARPWALGEHWGFGRTAVAAVQAVG